MSEQVPWIGVDEAWQEMVTHQAGSPPQPTDRMFIEAVLDMARTGIPWCNLPKALGHRNAGEIGACGAGCGRIFKGRNTSVQRCSCLTVRGNAPTSMPVDALKQTVLRRHRLWDIRFISIYQHLWQAKALEGV